MKKNLLIMFLSLLFIVLAIVIFFVAGIAADLLNMFLKNGIFSWFYKLYGIEFRWNLLTFLIFIIGSGYASFGCISLLYKKIMKKPEAEWIKSNLFL